MTDTYNAEVEQAITAKLNEHESAKLVAERKMEAARLEMLEAERAVDHWRFALEDYRKSHGLTARPPNPIPVLEAEYSHMGPTELVQYWSDKHDGEVVVKNLAKFAVNAGMSPNYRLASSSIYAVVKRKGYDKIGPGHFKKAGNPNGHYAERTPLPIVYPSDDRYAVKSS